MSMWTFPEDFLWGVATASYQVEGATHEDGRGTSIWDTFSRTPGKVRHGHTGDVACDQYHWYKEDVELMKRLGVKAYRFSIAWPRVFPEGRGAQNPRGLSYYDRLVDELLAAGIQPAPTLFHWDLPQALEDEGGWTSRETAKAFVDYAHACYEKLGDRVEMWMTLNEPWCASFLGYEYGVHAPGRTDGQAAFQAVHHLLLAHAWAVQAYRATGQGGRIGLAHNAEGFKPATRRPEDLRAAEIALDKQTRMFLGPIYGQGYPQRYLDLHPRRELPIESGDMETIAAPIDFLGLNFYSERTVEWDDSHPEKHSLVPTYFPKTDMGWDITPWGLYRMLHWLDRQYGRPAIYVTENGCAMPDELDETGQRVHDPRRVAFLRAYLAGCAQAIRDGVDLRGYFCWSFIDNFEWAFGYTRRFGLVYCDYVDQRRVPKDSYYFYRDVISGWEYF